MATLATGVRWGTETPAIYFDVSYTATRSGANMVYTVNVDFQALSSNYGRYFGYPIYLDLSLDGVTKVTKTTVKNASPSNWSAGQVYYHSTSFSIAKATGSTALGLKIYSGEGSSRSQSYSYSLPVSPAASVLTLPSAGFTVGTAGTINITRYDTSFSDTITYTVGSATGTVRSIASGTSISSFSWTPPTSLYNQMLGQTQRTGTMTITTKSGSTTVGTTTYSFTLTAATVYNRPVVSLSYVRGTGTSSSFVQSDNGPNLKVTTNIAVYGGQTAEYVLKLDGVEQVNTSGVTTSNRVKYIENVSTQSSHTLVATVTDTLNNSASMTATVSTEAVPMNINLDLPGVAFGKLAERANTLDMLWNIITTGRAQAQYVDVSNSQANGSQVRFKVTDKSDAVAGNLYVALVSGSGGRFYFRQYSADSDGNPLGTYEQYILPLPNQGRTDNATFNITTSKYNATLSKTYVSNSYVTSAGIGSLVPYRRGDLYVIRGNLYINSMPSGTTYTTICTISNYSAQYEAVLTVPAQNGSGVLLVTITTAGEVKIYNGSGVTINSYCRFNITIPCA